MFMMYSSLTIIENQDTKYHKNLKYHVIFIRIFNFVCIIVIITDQITADKGVFDEYQLFARNINS